MTKFKWHRSIPETDVIFEGDRSKLEGEFVEILRSPRNDETAVARVAIIHLDAGEYVEELV